MEIDWVDAPLQYKKVLLMCLLKCSRSVEIDGKPFYCIKMVGLTDVRTVKRLFTIKLDLCTNSISFSL